MQYWNQYDHENFFSLLWVFSIILHAFLPPNYFLFKYPGDALQLLTKG